MVAANLAFMLDKGRVSYAVSLLLARASSVKQFGICLLQLAIGGPQIALRDLEDLAYGKPCHLATLDVLRKCHTFLYLLKMALRLTARKQ